MVDQLSLIDQENWVILLFDFWFITFLLVPSNNFFLFFKDLITFTISLISLIVSVIPKPSVIEKFWLSLFVPYWQNI